MTMYIHAYVDQLRECVTIQTEQESTPLAHVILDPSALDGFIRSLAAERAKLADVVPSSLDDGSRIEAVVDPILVVSPHEKGKLLCIRHPGLGWLGFLLPEKNAVTIAELLSKRRE